MRTHKVRIILALLTLLGANPVFANNITISDFFAEDGPQMTASPINCGGIESQAYQQAGTVTVSSTGIYELADAGNLLGFSGLGQGIVDITVSVYEDIFDPDNPDLNRIGIIDEGDGLVLEAGRSYVLVIQPYCENTAGVFAVVIRGAGTISGAGFDSAAYSHGQHSELNDTADFPMGIGLHTYGMSAPVQLAESGLYYFGEVGINFNAELTLLAYEDSFDPDNPSANLAGSAAFAGTLNLSKDQNYVFVAVDEAGLGGNWQFVLFPPGEPRFNETLKGAWVTPGVDGSGIMMEIGQKIGVMFFAWFTFPDELPPVQSESASALESDQGIETNAELGSTDQRWLTAAGVIPPDASIMNVNYENTTGGLFNQVTPKPTTNSSYGTGTVEIIDCNNMIFTYDLPDGVVGNAAMVRAISDGMALCLESVNANPTVP